MGRAVHGASLRRGSCSRSELSMGQAFHGTICHGARCHGASSHWASSHGANRWESKREVWPMEWFYVLRYGIYVIKKKTERKSNFYNDSHLLLHFTVYFGTLYLQKNYLSKDSIFNLSH
jgi:hypothetical protein